MTAAVIPIHRGHRRDADPAALVRASRGTMSREAFAAAITPLLGWPAKPGMIRAWESGVPVPPDVIEACQADVLCDATPAELITTSPAPGAESAEVSSADAEDSIEIPCRMSDGRISWVSIPRRTFLQGIGTAALGMSAVGVGLRTAPAAVTGRPAERFLLARTMLRDLDNLTGPRDVIPLATRQVAIMRQMWPALRGADRRELLGVQIQFADLLGWLHQDCGDYESARQWLDRALEWSHIAEDRASTAFILARTSQLAGDKGDGAEAVAIAEAAMRCAGPRAKLAAVAATYASYGYALMNDRTACDRLCDKARSALGSAGGDGLPWAKFLDAAYIDVHHARSMAALGDYHAAAERFGAAMKEHQPGYHRDRGVYLAREARAFAGASELDHAAGLGLQALAIGSETRSGRIFTELVALESALPRQRPPAAVAEYRTALNAVMTRVS